MRYFKQKKTLLGLVITLLFFQVSYTQIKISGMVQESTMANSENKLYFIDFWATWCAPCIHVSKYLEVLQKQQPNNFYVISLTQENQDKVKRFVEKHDTDLAVAIDFNGETFKRFNISSLPYGVLLNAENKVLWQGHPANFSLTDLKKYLNKNSGTIAVMDFLKLQKVNTVVEKEYFPTTDFELLEAFETSNTTKTLEVKGLGGGFRKISGDLQSIVSFLLKCSRTQVVLPSQYISNAVYQLYTKLEDKDTMERLVNSLGLEISKSTLNSDMLYIDTSESKLWDANQIDWGKDSPNYLVDDFQIQADNVTLTDFLYKVSTLVDMPIKVSGKLEETTVHDFQIQYKFHQLMQSDFLDTYRIRVKKKLGDYTVYQIKKAQ